MGESDISKQDQFISSEQQKSLIKSQIYGRFYCSELLATNLPGNFKSTLDHVNNILLKEDLTVTDLDKVHDLITDLSVGELFFESRILLGQLIDVLLFLKDDELKYYNEIENIIDPYLEIKLRIYDYFKKSKYSIVLELCDQILENDKLTNYDKFILLGIKVRILGRIQDFKSADLVIDLALDIYDILSKKEKIKLELDNQILDKFNFINLSNIDFEDFCTIKLSMLYIIKCFYLENNGFEKEALDLIRDILPFYSNSKCELSYADLLNEKGRKEYKLSHLKEALIDFKEVFNIYLKLNDIQRQKYIFNNLSHIFIDKEDWSQAIEFIEKAINLSHNNDFNEILIISKSLLFYKMNKKIDSLSTLKQFINQNGVYKSQNSDILFNLNASLIMYLIIGLELNESDSLKIFEEKLKLLRKNNYHIRTEIDDLNYFVIKLINSNLNNKDLIKNVDYIKKQLKMYDLPILIKELL